MIRRGKNCLIFPEKLIGQVKNNRKLSPEYIRKWTTLSACGNSLKLCIGSELAGRRLSPVIISIYKISTSILNIIVSL